MSKKKSSPDRELSTHSVDNFPIRHEPRLAPDGSEVLSPISRTVTAYLPTMGERIRRYTKMPHLQRDLYNDPDYWDDEEHEVVFNDDGSVHSKHEERYQRGVEEAKKIKTERDKKEKEEAAKKAAEEAAAFRKRVREAIKDGETTDNTPGQ